MHHKMNMASLASSQDQSGNGRNGTVSNGQFLINQVAGAIPDLSDSALRVGRTGHYRAGSGVTPVFGKDWTLETWFYYPFPYDKNNCHHRNRYCTLVRTEAQNNQRAIAVYNDDYNMTLGSQAFGLGFLSSGYSMKNSARAGITWSP